MIGEGVVVHTVVHLRVWVACPLCAKLPYGPVFAMLGVEKLDERIQRIAVGALWVCAAGTGCSDDWAASARESKKNKGKNETLENMTRVGEGCTVVCHIAQVEPSLSVSGAWAGY